MATNASATFPPYTPAPYGQACAGCSRAKTKCFVRPGVPSCERCGRLNKPCEPSKAVRKRKAPTPPNGPSSPLLSQGQSEIQSQTQAQSHPTQLEAKIDDLVTLLRTQAEMRQQPHSSMYTPPSIEPDTPSPRSSHHHHQKQHGPINPDIMINTAESTLHFVPPASASDPQSSSASSITSPVLSDVLAHNIPDAAADEQLDIFRRIFLPTFPFVHIPPATTARALRSSRPFLWLVIMSLTSRYVPLQFSSETIIWNVITQRVVAEHMASMDLLLGMIAFATWSHFYKKEIPFMTTVAQLVVAMTYELGLQNDVSSPPGSSSRRGKQILRSAGPQYSRERSMEERRTVLAVYHVTSTTWVTYRTTEPLRWTPYLDACLQAVGTGEGEAGDLDRLLAAHVRCHLIVNQLEGPSADLASAAGDDGSGSSRSSTTLVRALLSQLGDVKRSLPVYLHSDVVLSLTYQYTELTIRQTLITKLPSPPTTTSAAKPPPWSCSPFISSSLASSSSARIQRLQDLEAILSGIERWLDTVWMQTDLQLWSLTVDRTSQLMRVLVVLFRLSVLTPTSKIGGSGDDYEKDYDAGDNNGVTEDRRHNREGAGGGAAGTEEPDWDTAEVRRRVDVLAVLDRIRERIDAMPSSLGLVDAEGPRCGIFFKSGQLFFMIRELFRVEMEARDREAGGRFEERRNGGGGGDSDGGAGKKRRREAQGLLGQGQGTRQVQVQVQEDALMRGDGGGQGVMEGAGQQSFGMMNGSGDAAHSSSSAEVDSILSRIGRPVMNVDGGGGDAGEAGGGISDYFTSELLANLGNEPWIWDMWSDM